jgi:hypothetical protein
MKLWRTAPRAACLATLALGITEFEIWRNQMRSPVKVIFR